MAIVRDTPLWRNLWRKKKKEDLKRFTSCLTSQLWPQHLPTVPPSPAPITLSAPLKFILKSMAHKAMQCCGGLKGWWWWRVIRQSEKVIGGMLEGGIADLVDTLKWMWRREKHWTHMLEVMHVWPLYVPLLLRVCVSASFMETLLCYHHRLSPGSCPCACPSSTITFCLPHKQTLYAGG